jgi:hypothetical protein
MSGIMKETENTQKRERDEKMLREENSACVIRSQHS